MFGTPRRAPRPVLYIIVFGVFIAIVGITAVAQILLVSAHFSTSTLNSVVGTDAALVRTFVTTTVSPDDLQATGPSAERRAALDARLAALVEAGEIVRIELRLPDGTVVASNDESALGTTVGASPDFTSALEGRNATASLTAGSASEVAGQALATTDVLREYFPLVDRRPGPSDRRDLAGRGPDPRRARGPPARDRPRDPRRQPSSRRRPSCSSSGPHRPGSAARRRPSWTRASGTRSPVASTTARSSRRSPWRSNDRARMACRSGSCSPTSTTSGRSTRPTDTRPETTRC